MIPSLWNGLADLAVFLRFFTRLPVPRLGPHDLPSRAPNFTTSAWMLPIVGILAAAPAALTMMCAHWAHLPPIIAAILPVAVGVLCTGALHEDGLADVADGFGGGRDHDRKLEIMRDSRVGSYGVVALILALSLRCALYFTLIRHDGADLAASELMLAAGASRAALLVPWVLLPSARPQGLAQGQMQPNYNGLALASILSAVIWLLFSAAIAPHGAHDPMAPLLLCALASAIMTHLARKHIGGFTGDVLGATQQLSEIGFLIGILVA